MIKIAFSGPNHSGKTTTLTAIHEELLKQGKDVIVFAENMHRLMAGKSIDEIRNNPALYLDIQEKCIQERIEFECNLKSTDNVVVLIDRPLTDSLYYLTRYLDPRNLTTSDNMRYDRLVNKTTMFCKELIPTATKILFFKPLNIACEDKTYRPQNVDELKVKDTNGMLELLNNYSGSTPVSHINLNVTSQRLIVYKLAEYINNKLK